MGIKLREILSVFLVLLLFFFLCQDWVLIKYGLLVLLHIEGMVLSFLTFVRNQVPNLFHFN